MANTSSIQASIQLATAEGGTSKVSRSFSLTQSGADYIFGTQAAGTDAATLVYTPCADMRYVMLTLPSTTTQTVTCTCSAFKITPGDVVLLPNVTAVTTQATADATAFNKGIVES